MSKYSRFKVWADQMANKIRGEEFNLTESVLSQDEGANEALADLKQKKISEDAIADAVTCIAYADHCTQALQKELEAVKAENEAIKAELATYKNASDPMDDGLRSLEWRFVWHGSGGKADSGMGVLRRGGRICESATNGNELLYVGEIQHDLDATERLIAKHNADLKFVALSKQVVIDQINAELEKLKTRQITDEMTEPVKQVLSMMVFQFIRMVQIYRQAGFNIPKKAEEEQAFCMHRFLIAALEHGENWKNVVNAELKEMVEKLETAK